MSPPNLPSPTETTHLDEAAGVCSAFCELLEDDVKDAVSVGEQGGGGEALSKN